MDRSLVKALHASGFTLNFLRVAFDSRSRLALSNRSRLLIEFTLPDLGENTRLLTGSFETSQRNVERFIFLNFYIGHVWR